MEFPHSAKSEETFLGLFQCYPNILITRHFISAKSLVVSIGVFKVFTLNISPKKILPPAYIFRIVGRGGEIIWQKSLSDTIIRWRKHQQWYIVTILHRITTHNQSTKVNIIIINIDDTIIQLLLLPQCLPLISLPDIFCLLICNLFGETKLKNRWHAILMHVVSFLLVRWWWYSDARAGGVRVCLGRILEIEVGKLGDRTRSEERRAVT